MGLVWLFVTWETKTLGRNKKIMVLQSPLSLVLIDNSFETKHRLLPCKNRQHSTAEF